MERRCHGDRETETEDREMERWRDGEMERLRSRARTWQATERDACSNGNVKGRGGKAGNQRREAWL